MSYDEHIRGHVSYAVVAMIVCLGFQLFLAGGSNGRDWSLLAFVIHSVNNTSQVMNKSRQIG